MLLECIHNTGIKLIDDFNLYIIEMLYEHSRQECLIKMSYNKEQNANSIVARRIKNRTVKYLRCMYVLHKFTINLIKIDKA